MIEPAEHAHPLATVQRIVLKGGGWARVAHVLLEVRADARSRASVPHLLQGLLALGWPMAAGKPEPQSRVDRQLSIGFTRWGLEQAGVPDWVMAPLRLKAPAFWAGAGQRGAGHLGLTGDSAPQHGWAPGKALHLVASLHALDDATIDGGLQKVKDTVEKQAKALRVIQILRGASLPAPPGLGVAPPEASAPQPMWVHFGYRDGLARLGIEGPDSKRV